MRWPIFLIFAFVTLVLELGLKHLIYVGESTYWITPSFLLVLGAFLSMWAPSRHVLWAMLVLGLLVDLQPPGIPVGDSVSATNIIGPFALGYLFAGYAALQIRGLMYRETPLAIAAMTFALGIFVNLVGVALLTFRGLPLPFLSDPIPGWSAADQLFHRFLELIYSAVLAVPLGFLLLRTYPIWGFDAVKGMGVRRMA